MEFDPTTARPVQATPNARPQGNTFDPTSARLRDPHEGETGWQRLTRGHADPDHPNLWNVVYGLQGAFQDASMNGLMVQPVREVMERTGYGMSELKRRYPGQTDAWYERRLHDAYNIAINEGRQEATQKVADNPYPGAPVANFGARVLGSADPTFAIPVPGVNGLTRATARIGATAAAHAGMSGAADAAAQVMDIAEGTTKDYDVKRNLEAAAFGGAFGATIGGLGEVKVPQFVTDLFKNRGVDTLPSSDPRANTQPLTTERPGLTPENQTQLRELIQTGSVDDIKNFFADKQGPKPTWKEVNDLVEARDAIPENSFDNYRNALNAHLDDTHTQVVRDHIEQQMDGWRNKPDVEVLRTAEDIADPEIRQRSIDQQLSHENTVGFVGPDGKVRVFAGAVKGPSDVNAVLFHEGLGHYGLRQRFGDTLDKTLHTLDFNNVGQFGKSVTKWIKDHPGEYKGNRIRAAEEVLAEMSEKGAIKKSVMDAFVGQVRRFGRQMGMKLSYSDTEIKNILRMAHDSVINGHGRDASANGFKFKRVDDEFDGPWIEKADEPTGYGIKGSKINDADIRGMADEFDASTAKLYEPEGPGRMSDEDVRQIMDEGEDGNVFMTPDQLKAARERSDNIHEDAFNHFSEGYVPKFRSIEEAQKAARDTALDYADVKKSKSVGHLDRKLFVYDNAAKEANAKMMLLAKEAETNGGLNHDQMNELIQTASQFHYVLSRLDNDLGEVGRALNVAKQLEFRRGNIVELKKALEEGESPLSGLLEPGAAEDFLKKLALMNAQGSKTGAVRLIKGVNKPYWWQYLLSWRSNMLLSGPSTHIKNMMDMATTQGREIEEKLAALPVGALRDMARAVGMKNVQQGVHPAEVASQLWGITRALMDASTYQSTANALKTGGYQRFHTSGIQNPRIPIVSKVQDLLGAEDTFYRAIFDNGNLYALGVREARKSGLTKWDDITTAAAGYAQHPSIGMLKEAQELSENTMLINKSQINDAIDRAKRIKPGMNGLEQGVSFMTNYLTPFIRVQSNALLNQVVRRSPLSILDPVTRADFKAGGARRDIAIMRTAIGTAVMAMYWQAAGDKKVTDQGPDEYNKLQELQASGWRPGAVHEDGRFNVNQNLNLSLNPFDMHNNVATLIAGIRQSYDQGASKNNLGLSLRLAEASVMSFLTKQTFIGDIGEAYNAFKDDGEKGVKAQDKFLGNELKTLLPNAMVQANKILDPVARDVSENPLLDTARSAIPGLSGGLPAQHTAYGEEKQTGTSITGVHTWLSDGNGQDEVTDPAHVEMARLGSLFRESLVPPVQRTITVKDTSQFNESQLTDAGNVRLSAQQFEEYQRMAGQEITNTMKDMMSEPDWDQMSDEDKAAAVRKMATDRKKAVRNYLYGG